MVQHLRITNIATYQVNQPMRQFSENLIPSLCPRAQDSGGPGVSTNVHHLQMRCLIIYTDLQDTTTLGFKVVGELVWSSPGDPGSTTNNYAVKQKQEIRQFYRRQLGFKYLAELLAN